MLRHLVGQQSDNTVAALKEHLGVDQLEVVLLDSVEEFYVYLASTGPPDKPLQVQ